jgi:hypothetical protein
MAARTSLGPMPSRFMTSRTIGSASISSRGGSSNSRFLLIRQIPHASGPNAHILPVSQNTVTGLCKYGGDSVTFARRYHQRAGDKGLPFGMGAADAGSGMSGPIRC